MTAPPHEWFRFAAALPVHGFESTYWGGWGGVLSVSCLNCSHLMTLYSFLRRRERGWRETIINICFCSGCLLALQVVRPELTG